MNTELFTKIGTYIVIGTLMFCIGVLVGYQLQFLRPEEDTLQNPHVELKILEHPQERTSLHDDF